MLLSTDKKGVSEMLSYVMLIIIAIAIAALVFGYLEIFVPKDKPKCPADISLIIKEASCEISGANSNLAVMLENKGLFNVDSVYIRFGESSKKVLNLVNNPDEYLINPENVSAIGLPPSLSYLFEKSLSSSEYPPDEYSVEIQPAVVIKNKIIICENAVSRQNLECIPVVS